MAGVRLAGGLVIALAVAASLAGTGLAAAAGIAVLAGLLATVVPEPTTLPGRWYFHLARVRALAMIPLIAVYASAFAAYVVPGYSQIAAAGLVLIAGWLNYSAVWISAAVRTIVLGLLIVGTVVLVGIGFGSAPGSLPSGDSKPWWGIALGALVLFPLLVVRPYGSYRMGRFFVATLLGVALGISAVYQLGTGLSLTFLKDLLVAAGESSLTPVLVVLAGIATAAATIDTVADAELEYVDWEGIAGLLAAAALAAFAGPFVLLILAGAGALVYTGYRIYVAYA